MTVLQVQSLYLQSAAPSPTHTHPARSSLEPEGAVVQLLLDSLELRPVLWPGAPAFKHDLVQEFGTFGRSRHPVALDDPLVGLLVAHGWRWRWWVGRG